MLFFNVAAEKMAASFNRCQHVSLELGLVLFSCNEWKMYSTGYLGIFQLLKLLEVLSSLAKSKLFSSQMKSSETAIFQACQRK